MDRDVFVRELESNYIFDEKYISSVTKASLDALENEPHISLTIVMEELAEVQQALSKYIRGKGDKINMIEELADLSLVINYIYNICDISKDEVEKATMIKAMRLAKNLEEGNIR